MLSNFQKLYVGNTRSRPGQAEVRIRKNRALIADTDLSVHCCQPIQQVQKYYVYAGRRANHSPATHSH